MAKENIFDIDCFEYDKGESYKNENDVPIPVHNLVNENLAHSSVTYLNLPKDDILSYFGESLRYEKDDGNIDPYLIVLICEDEKEHITILMNLFVGLITLNTN